MSVLVRVGRGYTSHGVSSSSRNVAENAFRNDSRRQWVGAHVKIDISDKAAAVIRKRGGTAVVDLLEPYG